jgi:hypothetical protein
MREEAIKVYELEAMRDENGDLELRPQTLINYPVDTVLIPGDPDAIFVLGPERRAKIRSLAIYQDSWCEMVSTFSMHEQVAFPELLENLTELVLLAVTETDKSRVRQVTDQQMQSRRFYPSFRRRTWAEDY